MFRIQILISILGWALFASGCGPAPAQRRASTEPSTPRFTPKNRTPSLASTITPKAAVEAALAHNLELEAHNWAVAAERGNARQAGLWPNPEIELEMEEFAGTGDFNAFQSTVSTVRVAQSIALFGKYKKAAEALEQQVDRLDRERELCRWEVVGQTSMAVIEVLTAQQKLVLLTKEHDLLVQFKTTVEARVEAGKAAPLEHQRAEVLVGQASVNLRNAARELKAAKSRLVLLWGTNQIDFDQIQGTLGPAFELPALAELKSQVERSPFVTQFDDALKLSRLEARAERAEAVPDLEIAAGLQHFNESGDWATTAAIAIELPLFDRNQGNIAAADATIRRREVERRAAVAQLTQQLKQAYWELESARESSAIIDGQILPQAEAAFGAVRQAYQLGKVGLVDFIDARRTLLETRVNQLESRAAFHLALVEVNRLLGRGQLRSNLNSAGEKDHE